MDDTTKNNSSTSPECGEQMYWDDNCMAPDVELPPKPWFGIDPYSDPAYLGAWVCWKCGHTEA